MSMCRHNANTAWARRPSKKIVHFLFHLCYNCADAARMLRERSPPFP